MRIILYRKPSGIAGLACESPKALYDYNEIDGARMFGEGNPSILDVLKLVYENNKRQFYLANTNIDPQISRSAYARLWDLFMCGDSTEIEE